MTETTPRSESSPAGRLIPNADKMRFKKKLVVEGPRPDTSLSDDLGGSRVVHAASETVKTNKVKVGFSV